VDTPIKAHLDSLNVRRADLSCAPEVENSEGESSQLRRVANSVAAHCVNAERRLSGKGAAEKNRGAEVTEKGLFEI
jgi:hypothetical protein